MEPPPSAPSDVLVRCTSCRTVYEFARGAAATGCPNCGGLSWISSRVIEQRESPVTIWHRPA